MGIPGGIRWTLSALVFVCGLGLLANVSAHADTGSTTSSGDNDLHGTQSGHENAPDESSGSTVINSTPTSTGPVGAGSAVEEIAVADDSAPARTRRTVRELHAHGDISTAEITTTNDDLGPVGPLGPAAPSTRFDRWRGLSASVSTPDDLTLSFEPEVTRQRRVRFVSLGDVGAAPLVSKDPPHAARPAAPIAAELAEDIGRQVGGPSGPPGPVGPPVPAASLPDDVVASPAPAPVAPTPAPVVRRPVAAVHNSLPVNGAESARMAVVATVLIAVGFALMAAARRCRTLLR